MMSTPSFLFESDGEVSAGAKVKLLTKARSEVFAIAKVKNG